MIPFWAMPHPLAPPPGVVALARAAWTLAPHMRGPLAAPLAKGLARRAGRLLVAAGADLAAAYLPPARAPGLPRRRGA